MSKLKEERIYIHTNIYKSTKTNYTYGCLIINKKRHKITETAALLLRKIIKDIKQAPFICICANPECSNAFYRPPSIFFKYDHHFCSNKCKIPELQNPIMIDKIFSLYFDNVKREEELSVEYPCSELNLSKAQCLAFEGHCQNIEQHKERLEQRFLKTRSKPWQNRGWLYKEYVEKNLSAYQIAKKSYCHINTIRSWLDKFNIKQQEANGKEKLIGHYRQDGRSGRTYMPAKVADVLQLQDKDKLLWIIRNSQVIIRKAKNRNKAIPNQYVRSYRLDKRSRISGVPSEIAKVLQLEDKDKIIWTLQKGEVIVQRQTDNKERHEDKQIEKKSPTEPTEDLDLNLLDPKDWASIPKEYGISDLKKELIENEEPYKKEIMADQRSEDLYEEKSSKKRKRTFLQNKWKNWKGKRETRKIREQIALLDEKETAPIPSQNN